MLRHLAGFDWVLGMPGAYWPRTKQALLGASCRPASLSLPPPRCVAQTKLKDLPKAASDAGLHSLVLPLTAVNTGVLLCFLCLFACMGACWTGSAAHGTGCPHMELSSCHQQNLHDDHACPPHPLFCAPFTLAQWASFASWCSGRSRTRRAASRSSSVLEHAVVGGTAWSA